MAIVQKSTKELIQDYLGGTGLERVYYVVPLPTDRRRGRNYRVVLANETSEIYRVYFNREADGTDYIEEMV